MEDNQKKILAFFIAGGDETDKNDACYQLIPLMLHKMFQSNNIESKYFHISVFVGEIAMFISDSIEENILIKNTL